MDPTHEIQFSAPLQLQHSCDHATADSFLPAQLAAEELESGKRPLLRHGRYSAERRAERSRIPSLMRGNIVWTSEKQKAEEAAYQRKRVSAAISLQYAYHARVNRVSAIGFQPAPLAVIPSCLDPFSRRGCSLR